MASTNKKRTAVAAVATAAALVLTGTFAWVMENDQTELNKFTAKDPGTYKVELKEDFNPNNPWANKDVWVENKGDNPVIVRVRFEEFYDLEYRNGTTYNNKKGLSNGDEDGKAIFKVPGPSTLADNLTADSSTGIDKNVILKFGENGAGVTTMEKWKAMEDKSAINWVIDKDGWCYYTKALLYGEKTSYLLDDVDFNEALFLETHSKPYNLDYKINVRLQAISADLEDFGSHINDMQWTNTDYINDKGVTITNAGRIIADDPTNDYEILDDSTITDDAMALVAGISGEFRTLYSSDFRNADGSVAVTVSTAQELNAAINNPDVHSILLTSDITITNDTSDPDNNLSQCYFMTSSNGDKMVDLGEYTLTRADGKNGLPLFYFYENPGTKLAIKHGKIDSGGSILIYTNCIDTNAATEYIELVGVEATTASAGLIGGNVSLYNSKLTVGLDALPLQKSANVIIDNSQVVCNQTGICANYGATDVSLTIRNNSLIQSDEGIAVVPYIGWMLQAKDSTFIGEKNAIAENHYYPPKYVNLENCTLNATVGYYKAAPSKLTMKNCQIEATGGLSSPGSDNKAVGVCVRSGDVTLDNVKVTTSQGTFSDSDSILTDEELSSRYNDPAEANGPVANFEPIQVILNQYDSINLRINGGSYTSTYQGHDSHNNPVPMRSVYIHDSIYTIHTEGSEFEYPYTFNNTITITGDPKFTPSTDVFDQDYAHTTIAKN